MMKRIMVAILFLVGINFGPGEDFAYGQSYIDSFAAGCNSGNTYNNSFIVVSSDLVVGSVGSATMNVNIKTCRVSYGSGNEMSRTFRMGRVDGGTSEYNGTYFIFVSDGSAGNNVCETVPDAYRQYLNCPTPEPTEATPEEKCSQYQNLFDPPSGNCLFQFEYGTKCVDGAGNGIYYEYRVRASDGRTSDWQNSQTSTENEGVECISYESQCSNPEGCWVPSDLDRCVYKDSDGNIKMKQECWVDSSSPPESGWSDLCDMGVVECPPKGGDDGGGGTPGGGDDGGGGGDNGGGGGTTGGGGGGGTGGGGDDGGGGTPGGGADNGGGGTPGGGDDGGGGGTPGGGGDTPGGTGGGGGGTGGGESGTGDDDEDLGSHSGDGGWGEIDGKPGMDKGRDDLEARLDKIFSDIEGSGTFKEIEGHKYITLIEPVCSLEFNLPMLGGSVYYDFCKYRSQLEVLGKVIFGVVTIAGFLMLVRL